MRKTLFVGNWKSTKNVAETEEYFRELPQHTSKWKHEVVLMPSFICLDVARRFNLPDLKLGAQEVSHMGTGACNGDIPASSLKSLGVKYCLVGHVDRRAMGEENSRINIKLNNCLGESITPILCIGETLQEYESNRTREVLEKQLRECLVGVNNMDNVIIAYQPIWSIGTGHVVNTEYIGLICEHIRKTVVSITGNAMSANFTLLYGGGPITAQTAKGFLEMPDIDGLMMTFASYKPSTFTEVITTEFAMQRSNA